jgi:hypothetical protein
LIRVSTPSPFLTEFSDHDPDGCEIVEWLWLELGDGAFNIRSEYLRQFDWPELRVWGAMARLFAHEILVEIPETVH